MATTVAWGPIHFAANAVQTSPAVTIPAADSLVTLTADYSALPAGVSRSIMIHYRKSTSDPWQEYGSVTGTTVGGVDRNRAGQVTEWGLTVHPLPDVGTTGRQLRASGSIGQTANLSGHVTTG